jgi:hypothetical protein
MASKKKSGPPEEPPVPTLAEMTVGDVARANLEAFKSKDISQIVRIMEATSAACPPPEPERPMGFSFDVPVLEINGTPAVGVTLRVAGDGGPSVELTVEGTKIRVKLSQLGGALNAASMLGMQGRPSGILR